MDNEQNKISKTKSTKIDAPAKLSKSELKKLKSEDKKKLQQSRSTFSFRKIIPQKQVDVYAVVTETTTTTERVKKKRKTTYDRLQLGSDDSFGSFIAGPHYYHLETADRRKKGVTWMTTEIASVFPRTQLAVESALGELLIYIIFVTIVIVVILNLNINGKYHYGTYLKHNIIGRPQDFGYGFGSTDIKNFEEINNQRHMFRYLNDTFVESDFMDYYYKRAYENRPLHIRDTNYILGSIKIRQFRVNNDSCIIPDEFSEVFNMKTCYGEYNEKNNGKFIILPNSAALGVLTTEAFRSDPFMYQEPDLDYNVHINTQHGSYPGTGGYVAKYISGFEAKGGKTSSFIDQDKFNSYTNQMLYATGWIRRHTRVVIVELLNYNPSVMMMGRTKVLFEYLPTGGIVPSVQINVIRVYHLLTALDYFILGCMWSIASFNTMFVIEEIREIGFFGLKYFLRFWSWIDMAIIFCGTMSILHLIFATNEMKLRTDEYFGLESYISGTLKIDKVISSELLYEEYTTWLCFFTCFKIIRFAEYFGHNDRFSRTFNQAGGSLVAFAVRYTTAFFAFAVLGYFLFGTYIEAYSTFTLACMALIRFYFGYIEYDDLVVLRGFWGLFYVLVVTIYMVGYMIAFLLVVLLNYYAINESEVVIKRGATAGGMLCSWCTRFKHMVLTKRKGKMLPVDNITTDELLDSLDILNFTDPEIDLFQIKYILREDHTSEPEDVSKILWDLIEEIRTDVRNDDADLHGAELEDVKDEKIRPLYTKQYNGLVKQMKNLEVQAEILLEKVNRCVTTVRVGKTMLQPPTIIKDERLNPPKTSYDKGMSHN